VTAAPAQHNRDTQEGMSQAATEPPWGTATLTASCEIGWLTVWQNINKMAS
jgi:hypothetical protein